MNKLIAAIFYYLVRPVLNRWPAKVRTGCIDCPCCGALLGHYTASGFLHVESGDADCYGVLGKGKGSFK